MNNTPYSPYYSSFLPVYPPARKPVEAVPPPANYIPPIQVYTPSQPPLAAVSSPFYAHSAVFTPSASYAPILAAPASVLVQSTYLPVPPAAYTPAIALGAQLPVPASAGYVYAQQPSGRLSLLSVPPPEGCSPPPSMSNPYILIELNPALWPSAVDPNISPLRWNLAHMPILARTLTPSNALVKPSFDADAVFPSCNNKMHITCADHIPISRWMHDVWGEIMILKDEKLTIKDVLDGIHDYFHRPMTRREYDNALVLHPGNEERLLRAAYDRVQRSHQLMDVEIQQGFKRIDMLGDFHYFNGLTVRYYIDSQGNRCWGAVLDLTNVVPG